MKRRLRNTIALFGAILTLVMAFPSFAQYRRGYTGRRYYYSDSRQSERAAHDRSHIWRGSRRWHPNYVALSDHLERPAMDSPRQYEEGDFDNYNPHGACYLDGTKRSRLEMNWDRFHPIDDCS